MAKHTERDKRMAAYLKDHNVVRTTCRCAQCYRMITCDSNMSRYTHVCRK